MNSLKGSSRVPLKCFVRAPIPIWGLSSSCYDAGCHDAGPYNYGSDYRCAEGGLEPLIGGSNL